MFVRKQSQISPNFPGKHAPGPPWFATCFAHGHIFSPPPPNNPYNLILGKKASEQGNLGVVIYTQSPLSYKVNSPTILIKAGDSLTDVQWSLTPRFWL